MDLLVIGGTRFVGRHLVAAALARGHRVTLFNRGSNAELYPQLEQLRGDRDRDLTALHEQLRAGRRWDAVIDTCGYLPRQLHATGELLASAVDRYLFISSISVYADFTVADQDESAATAALTEATEEITAETYGALKAACEQTIEELLPGRVLVVRPGLVVGPYDPTGRFSYWPARVAKGGAVLAPGGPEAPLQYIDARDLASWSIAQLEQGTIGTFNLVTPPGTRTFGELLAACQEAVGRDAGSVEVVWVEDAFLLEQGVQPFADLPLWLGGVLMPVRSARAVAAGLRPRPLADTVADTAAWLAEAGHEVTAQALAAGLPAAREVELLRAWRQRQGADGGQTFGGQT